jgi:hypothetical protein
MGLTTKSIDAGTLHVCLVTNLSLCRFCLNAVKKNNMEIGGLMMVLFVLLTIMMTFETQDKSPSFY